MLFHFVSSFQSILSVFVREKVKKVKVVKRLVSSPAVTL